MSHDATQPLLTPLSMGPLTLPNRVVMAPMTRNRAEKGNVPAPISATYYGQRASAGLIVTEATQVCPMGQGYISTPGIHSNEQVEGWRRITETVHQKGGVIFLQLWHVGRISHPSLQPDGALPVAPSAVRANVQAYTASGFKACPTPRALAAEEIPAIVAQYARAARNALDAGFDGVEVHAANGYLIEQFLRDSGNHRSDAYGGSREKRARFLLQVVEAVASVCGGGRTGVRLSPLSPVNDLALDSDPADTYGYVVEQLNDFGLAYLHVIEGVTQGPREVPLGFDLQLLRRTFQAAYIANNGYDRELALEARRKNRADLIAFGRPYIANPDLVERLRAGAPLNAADRATFFGGDARGYTDYPFMEAGAQATAGVTP